MLNQTLKLNSKIFDADCEQKPIRAGFGEGLLIAGKNDERVVGLSADLAESTQMESFAKEFPKRFVEIGISEQSLVSVASGMAAMGKIPFASSFAIFSPGRSWEQIRTTICFNNTNVKIVGSHAGVSDGADGGTHQALEDIALTRILPNMTVISPCDAIEAKKVTIAAAKMVGPVYLRLNREKTPVITTEDTPFEIGKAQVFFASDKKAQVGIIVTGALLARAIRVAHSLSDKGIAVKVMNLATIKPLDTEAVLNLAKETGAIVTVEEHQIAGGMGSAVAECLAKWLPTPQEFVGVKDQFGQSGTYEELIAHYGMDEKAIKSAVREVLQRKK